MKARITLSLLVLAFSVACSKPKPAEMSPMTGEEKFQTLNQARTVNDAQQAAEQARLTTPEAKARGAALLAYQNTKEYKAAASAQQVAEEAGKKALATKEGKDFIAADTAAIAAGQITKEAKSLTALTASSTAAQEDIFKKRGVSPKTHFLCVGSSTALIVGGVTPDSTAISETCKDVADSDIELREIKHTSTAKK